MVNRPLDYAMINEISVANPRVGTRIKKGRRTVEIRWPEPLFLAVKAEADKREWSFGHMVRHLCEASIDGIE